VPLVPAAPPQPVPVFSGFDYVAVDAQRRRVYAAHSGSRALLVVDADTGAVVGQVRVGPMRGLAVNPADGHVFTANGDDRSVSEVDPQTLKVLRSVDLPQVLDALAFDAARSRIYVDEDDGPHFFVLDAKTFKVLTTLTLPATKLEYLAVDPETHDVYQNIDDRNAFAIIDGTTLKLKKIVSTPELQHNHPLQYDPLLKQIVTGGNGVLSAYDRSGTKLGQTAIPRVDQCDLDASTHTLACAGGQLITVLKLQPGGAPVKVAEVAVPPGCHTVAIDAKTRAVWAVWATPNGDFIQRFNLTD
jgi:DNA-binding beta-propeller fold protein YncE